MRTRLLRVAPVEPELVHEASHLVTADLDALAAQLAPDLAHAVDREVRRVDAGDLDLQLLVTDRPAGRWPGAGRVVGGWGDLQDLADRLDPEDVTVSVDVARHRFAGRSSSAAKKAEADLRISLARRSSRFSRSSSLMRWASSLVVPAR